MELSGEVPLNIMPNLTKFDITTEQNSCSSLSRKIYTTHNKVQHCEGLDVSDTTSYIHKKYNSYKQKWHIYCQENNIHPATPNITNVLDTYLYLRNF